MPEYGHVTITGAESGIGAACAIAIGAASSKISVFYHEDRRAAEDVAVTIKDGGGEATCVQCGVDNEASVGRAFMEAERQFGPADTLVNSGGINMSGISVRDMSSDAWQCRIATDSTGAFLTSKRFLAGRPEGAHAGSASIVHISSIHADVVRAGGAAYCAAKGGLTRLVQTLAAEEAARGVRVNAIEVGTILTPMNEKALEHLDYRAGLEKNIPMKRAGRPEEVARFAVWLVSEDTSYITGATIVIDGGLSILLGVGA